MTWKQAVQKVAKTESSRMLSVAESLVGQLAEAEKCDALARALLREAHSYWRVATRSEELAAVQSTPGRKRNDASRVSNELKKRLGPVLEEWREELRLEWTTELLSCEFTLRDGTSVTWGDATVGQHKERATIFMDNAAANMDGAARHNAAIRVLEKAGAISLNDAIGCMA